MKLTIKTEELRRGDTITGTITTFSHNGSKLEFQAYNNLGQDIIDEIVRRCLLHDANSSQ